MFCMHELIAFFWLWAANRGILKIFLWKRYLIIGLWSGLFHQQENIATFVSRCWEIFIKDAFKYQKNIQAWKEPINIFAVFRCQNHRRNGGVSWMQLNIRPCAHRSLEFVQLILSIFIESTFLKIVFTSMFLPLLRYFAVEKYQQTNDFH